VANAGHILGGTGGAAISGGTINVTANTGTISGDFGIFANVATVGNAGTITGTTAGINANTVNVTGNAGTISGGAEGIHALNAAVTNASTGTFRVGSTASPPSPPPRSSTPAPSRARSPFEPAALPPSSTPAASSAPAVPPVRRSSFPPPPTR
jgi:hypothetical protein